MDKEDKKIDNDDKKNLHFYVKKTFNFLIFGFIIGILIIISMISSANSDTSNIDFKIYYLEHFCNPVNF